MFKCDCGRSFVTKQGLGQHKTYCGKNKIGVDGGYQYYIGNNGEKVYIHREVLEKKIGRKLLPHEIAHHKDHDKQNNNPDNLEVKNKITHGKVHCKKEEMFGIKNINSKLNPILVKEIRYKAEQGQTFTSIGKQYNIDRRTVSNIFYRKSWKHVL